jgi:hypothetical protein
VTYNGIIDMTLIPLSPDADALSGCVCTPGTASYFATAEAPDATGSFPDFENYKGGPFDMAVVSGKIQVTYAWPGLECVTTYTVSSGTVMGVGDAGDAGVLAASTVNLAARPAAAAWALLAVAATLMALLA